jgi:hypothetical protein
MISKCSARPVSRKTRFPARYMTPFRCRLAMSGAFHWNRKRACPSDGMGWNFRISPVRALNRSTSPPCDSS